MHARLLPNILPITPKGQPSRKYSRRKGTCRQKRRKAEQNIRIHTAHMMRDNMAGNSLVPPHATPPPPTATRR